MKKSTSAHTLYWVFFGKMEENVKECGVFLDGHQNYLRLTLPFYR
ncbi:hypothetical protein [Algoriphagus sp.]